MCELLEHKDLRSNHPYNPEKSGEELKTLLEGTDVAWAQYKHGQGTRVTSTKELDDFLDSL